MSNHTHPGLLDRINTSILPPPFITPYNYYSSEALTVLTMMKLFLHRRRRRRKCIVVSKAKVISASLTYKPTTKDSLHLTSNEPSACAHLSKTCKTD